MGVLDFSAQFLHISTRLYFPGKHRLFFVKKHILIVEDESDIASALAARLRSEGFLVAVADNGDDGLDLAINEDYDLAILDIMLPGIDGLEIASQLQKEKNTAILVLSALDDENDVVSGLNVGADDYVTKPFSAREVVARVHALLRRIDNENDINSSRKGVQLYGALKIDSTTHSVTLNNIFVHTTPTEFKLLSVLSSRPGEVFTREDLLQLFVSDQDDVKINEVIPHSNLRTVDSHVRSLRKKIGSHYIRTIHAVGYSFEIDDSRSKVSA